MPHLRMLCEFELGRMLKDLPTVDVRLSGARFGRRRGPWELVAAFPEATESGVHEESGEERVQIGMFCPTFVVELVGSSTSAIEEAVAPAFDCLLELARDVADTIWVAQQTQGFAGSAPRIIRHELEVDGAASRFDLAQEHGIGVMFVGLPMVMYDDLRLAAEDAVRPSVARMLLAQATRWGLAEHFASKSAALLLAATACEVAIKSVVSRDLYGHLGTLAGVLDPQSRQAPLSPSALLEHVVPLALGRLINEELPGLIKKYKALTKLRDTIVHTGTQIDQKTLRPHLNTARQLLDWIEDRVAEVPGT